MKKHSIYVPSDLDANQVTIADLKAQHGDKVRSNEIVATLCLSGDTDVIYPVIAPCAGRVRYVAKQSGSAVAPGELLLIIEKVETATYRPDRDEVSQHTELGENGRRYVERKGQSEFGKTSRALFEPHNQDAGMSASGLPAHPFMQNMKEGVPPKMTANAAQNNTAIDNIVEEAQNNPELKMSPSLKNQLQISPSPSSAPTPSPR